MKDYLEQRILSEADYILKYHCTIRQCARFFGVSKSTVHLDLSKRLKFLDYRKFARTKDLLEYNYSVKHIRGGESVKRKAQIKNNR